MKKLVFLMSFFVGVMLLNFSVSQAATVRVADVGVYNLIQDMRTTVHDINKEMTNLIPVTIGNAVRVPQLDKNYADCSGWRSKIYKEGTTDQKAWIDFYADGQGYVSRINFAISDLDDSQSSGMVLGVCLVSLGLSQEEYVQFYKSFWNKVQAALKSDDDNVRIRDSIYCSAKKRYIDIYLYNCTKGHLHLNLAGRI